MVVEKLKKVKDSESGAEKIISMAEQKANSILEEAHRKGTTQAALILDGAHKAAEEIVAQEEKKIEKSIKAIREQAEKQKKSVRSKATGKYDQAVASIIERITHLDGRR